MNRPSQKSAAILVIGAIATAACLSDRNDTPLTTARCVEMGGVIVADIGDGRVHRTDYLCESGERPFGPIEFLEGQPIPVEGAVCCPQFQ